MDSRTQKLKGSRTITISLVRRSFSHTGGAEAYLKRLGRGLNDAGHNATLYSTKDWPSADWPYGKIVHLKGNTPFEFADAIRAARDPNEILFSLERLWECDCYRAGDGVHQLWLNRRAAHESSWKARFRFINRKHRQILKLENNLFQLQGARQVIANSHFVKEEIIREFKYPPERISVVHNGLPDTQFKTKPGVCSETRSSWGLRDDELAIVFVGAGWGRKGLQYAIQAVNRINQAKVRLIVVGAGKKGLFSSKCVQFLGSVQDMASVYASVDLFILPTIYDAFSNACLEALSFGLPVITTPTNGFTEIMTPGVHGEIVRGPDDVEGLTSAILAWKDPQKRATARAACIELARSHTMGRNVTETLRVLEKLSR